MDDQFELKQHLLHKSSDPMWVRIRSLLAEKGIDPQSSLLVEIFPDDYQLFFGLIISPDDLVYQFDYNYRDTTIGNGVFSRWADITDNYEKTPYSKLVNSAFRKSNKRDG
jgi:hypothetical protein